MLPAVFSQLNLLVEHDFISKSKLSISVAHVSESVLDNDNRDRFVGISQVSGIRSKGVTVLIFLDCVPYPES